MSENKKTKWVSTELDDSVFRAVQKRATEKGVHPSILIAQYIVRGLATDAKLAENPDDYLKTFADYDEARERDELRTMAVKLAQDHNREDSEETAERLRRVCERHGFVIENITKLSDSVTVPVTCDNGRGVSSAMVWIRDTMKPGRYYSNDVIEMAEAKGFSKATINEAKRQLGIKSERDGSRWVWLIEGEVKVSNWPRNDKNMPF